MESALSNADITAAIVKQTNDGNIPWKAAFVEQPVPQKPKAKPKRGGRKRPDPLEDVFTDDADSMLILQAQAELSVEGEKFFLSLACSARVKDGAILPPAPTSGQDEMMAMLGMGGPQEVAELVIASDDQTFNRTLDGRDVCEVAQAVLAFAKRQAPVHAAAFTRWAQGGR
jgi:hypothetical protein